MTPAKVKEIRQYIRAAASAAASVDALSVRPIERFLLTGEESWEGAGSGRWTLAQLNRDEIHTKAAKRALKALLTYMGNLLPDEVRLMPLATPEQIQTHIEPMVTGLVQLDWQLVALRELASRTFVLNFPGANAAIDAELQTCYLGAAWQIFWAFCDDYGLKLPEIDIGCDGLSAGAFAHVRVSADAQACHQVAAGALEISRRSHRTPDDRHLCLRPCHRLLPGAIPLQQLFGTEHQAIDIASRAHRDARTIDLHVLSTSGPPQALQPVDRM